MDPVVRALRNGTLGLIPVSSSKCLWSPEPDPVVSQVAVPLAGVSGRKVGWGSFGPPPFVQTSVCWISNVHGQGGSATRRFVHLSRAGRQAPSSVHLPLPVQGQQRLSKRICPRMPT